MLISQSCNIMQSCNKNAYAGPHIAVAPSGHRRNLPFSSSAETVILAIVLAVVPIKLVGPNTAVFGIKFTVYHYYFSALYKNLTDLMEICTHHDLVSRNGF